MIQTPSSSRNKSCMGVLRMVEDILCVLHICVCFSTYMLCEKMRELYGLDLTIIIGKI